MNYYLAVLKKYAVFKGRATRSEYWFFVLFNFIISIVLGIVAALIGDNFNIIGMLYGLAVLIPGIAVSVRRLHDVGKSGWMLFLSLIPIIGFIWLLVLMVTGSNEGENKYGPKPSN
ncbi:MAG: DUF805 domain-containing protein [Patescibacteria group bacterium]